MRRFKLAALLLCLPLALAGRAVAQERPVLELSLDEAVKRALENNVDIAVARYTPESSGFLAAQAEGAYDPTLTSLLSQGSQKSPATNVFAGALKVTTDTTTYNLGASQLFSTGGSARLDFHNTRTDTNSVFSTFNPSYNSSLTLSVTQPLLRNLKLDSARYQLRLARKNKEISDVQFRQTVVNVVANVKGAYYTLIYAIDNLEATRKSLALAKKLLDENQIKVKVGTLAPLDVVAAESEVAAREEGVIVAEAAVTQAEDAIKRSIYPRNDPAVWPLRVLPTDRPTAEPFPVDLEGAIRKALEQRTDIKAARKSLENAGLGLDYAASLSKPGLDLQASYGTTGIGGTQLQRENPPFGAVVSTVPGGYSDDLSQVFGRDFPTWTVALNFSYPIRNRAASAGTAQARVLRDQAEASLRSLEVAIVAEVRSAARAVETAMKRVDTTRAARVLRQRQLDAEEKKFAAGMSTNFLVTQAQRDLANAEVAELQATADYRKSLVTWDRVQEAGLSSAGLSGTLTLSTGGSGL